jgi:hypothetical protein
VEGYAQHEGGEDGVLYGEGAVYEFSVIDIFGLYCFGH